MPKVFELLDKRSRWIQNDFALNSDSQPVRASSVEATCFCFAGAVIACYPDSERDKIKEKIAAYIREHYPSPHDGYTPEYRNPMDIITTWNDSDARTYQDVLNVAVSCDV